MATDRRAMVSLTPKEHERIAAMRSRGDEVGAQRLLLAKIDGRKRGATWWLLVGWWWAPACWAGRVLLWLVVWPLGLWRSLRHGQRKAARR